MLMLTGQVILWDGRNDTHTDDAVLVTVQPVVRTYYLSFALKRLHSRDLP